MEVDIIRLLKNFNQDLKNRVTTNGRTHSILFKFLKH